MRDAAHECVTADVVALPAGEQARGTSHSGLGALDKRSITSVGGTLAGSSAVPPLVGLPALAGPAGAPVRAGRLALGGRVAGQPRTPVATGRLVANPGARRLERVGASAITLASWTVRSSASGRDGRPRTSWRGPQ
jgi:hypothetical protein